MVRLWEEESDDSSETESPRASPKPPAPPAFLLRPLFGAPLLAVATPAQGGVPAAVLGRNRQSGISNLSLGGIGRSISRRHVSLRAMPSAGSDMRQSRLALQAEAHSVVHLLRGPREQAAPPSQAQRQGDVQRLEAGATVTLQPGDQLFLLRRDGHLLFGFSVERPPAAPADEEAPPPDEQPLAPGAAVVETPAAPQGSKRGRSGVEGEAEDVRPAQRASPEAAPTSFVQQEAESEQPAEGPAGVHQGVEEPAGQQLSEQRVLAQEAGQQASGQAGQLQPGDQPSQGEEAEGVDHDLVDLT